MKIFSPDEPLTCSKEQLSFLSYNILLPNNTEGWWIHKCYPPHTPREYTTWKYRKQLLLKQILGSASDIIFLQEVAESSWKEDFHSLLEAGYEGILHAKKNLFRCATFTKTSKVEIIETKHCFRTLVHLAKWNQGFIGLINVHLSGGPHPKIRIAQIHEALDTLKKFCVVHKIVPDSLPVVMGGDFNSNPLDAPVHHFLTNGELSSNDRDSTYPDIILTQKGKKQVFPSFFHAYSCYFPSPPPTLYGKPLISDFCLKNNKMDIMTARNELRLSDLIKPEVKNAIQELFTHYEYKGTMDAQACQKWLLRINGGLRGGEWSNVQKSILPLTVEQFESIYIQNLTDGLWWSLDWDLHEHNIQIDRSHAPLHQETLDHFVVRKLRVQGLYDIPVIKQDGLPNKEYPSDHLPIGMIIERE